MSSPVCKAHPTSRTILVQYVEGNLSFVCMTCGVDLPDEPEKEAPANSEVQLKVGVAFDAAAEE